jgi:uncharacterized membrane protein
MVRRGAAVLVAALIMVVVDLIWLGVFASAFYNEQLGPLLAKRTNWTAAGLFYIQYIAVVVFFGALPAKSLKSAAGRGALLGWFAYATYELTNWAVIEAWPSGLVAVDIAWGVMLTAIVSSAAYLAYHWGDRSLEQRA